MSKLTIIFLGAVLAASGCVSNSPDQAPDEKLDTDGVDDSTTTFTEETENMTMKLKTDNRSETYKFTINQKSKVDGNQYFNRYQSVNLSARVMCGLSQQIAYNYSNIAENGESSGLNRDNELSKGLGGSNNNKDSELPEWPFRKFEPEKVEYTLIDGESSEELASCEPTEENLNIEINIEPNSEETEGLS